MGTGSVRAGDGEEVGDGKRERWEERWRIRRWTE